MEAVAASVVAVLGTLLGAGITHRFQQRGAERTERFTREERLRQERMDAYCAFAGALLNYRRTVVHRWYCEHEGRGEDEIRETRLRACVTSPARRRAPGRGGDTGPQGYDLRSEAQEALFRVQMLTSDEALVERAWPALWRIDEVHRAPDRGELDARRDVTRALVNQFVGAAKERLG
ncbi:hypothetical protein [Streptomyces sp. NPDC020298]|uniref:hypothetical protein n=1 Tax=unclassified Streptomyces TaxID=2593676 RepID=UPI00340E3B2C